MLAYTAPIFAYIALSSLEGYLPKLDGQPDPNWYFAAYAIKVAIVGFLAVWFRATWRDLRPWPGSIATIAAVAIGLFVCLIWVGLDGLYPPMPLQGAQRVGFDPGAMPTGMRDAFIAVRMLGLVVLVPLIEELFWRSFLIRWLIDQDIRKIPVGRVTGVSAAVTSVMFALVHPEWLPAFLTGLLWAWLLWWTRSVGACVISHAVANLALGIYVLISGDWKYW
jgi:CAAX prenyl protease-like protein